MVYKTKCKKIKKNNITFLVFRNVYIFLPLFCVKKNGVSMYIFFKQTEMTKYKWTELFTRLSEKANLSKQYAQRTVFANAPCRSCLCRRRTSMLASYRGSVEWRMHYTVALGYCLNRCALSESIQCIY